MSLRSCSTRSYLLVGCALLLIFTGCGDGRPKRVPTSGQVLIDGQPLEHGFVQVIPEGDRAATGKLESGGRFTLTTFDPNDGCVPGKHAVVVIATESIDGSSQRWHAPKQYMDASKSGLTIEVTDPSDAHVINLSWKDSGQNGPFIEKFDAE